jgi:hypothetical protein
LSFVGIFPSFKIYRQRLRAPSTVRENRLPEMPQHGIPQHGISQHDMDIELADISHSRHLFTIAEEEGGTEFELVDRGEVRGENIELGEMGNREMNDGHINGEKEKLEELQD